MRLKLLLPIIFLLLSMVFLALGLRSQVPERVIRGRCVRTSLGGNETLNFTIYVFKREYMVVYSGEREWYLKMPMNESDHFVVWNSIKCVDECTIENGPHVLTVRRYGDFVLLSSYRSSFNGEVVDRMECEVIRG